MVSNDLKKVEVLNTISLFNTVGQELEHIVEVHQKDKDELLKILKWTDFCSVKKIKKYELPVIKSYLNLGDELDSFVISFQERYFVNEKKALCQYRKSVSNFKQLKNVTALMRNEFNSGMDILEDITDYFGVDTEDDIFQESERIAALFRQQNKVEVNPINLKAWLRRGEIDFEKMNIPAYNEEAFSSWIETADWKNHIENKQYFLSLPKVLSKFGVALIYVPFLPHTVYGAVRWFDNKPLIQISDRNRDLASCWFTLFHEFGHVLLHKNDDIFEGELNDSKPSEKEKAANKFANQHLFNGDDLRKEVFQLKRENKIIASDFLANKYQVNSLFTSYWLRKAQIQPQLQKYVNISFESCTI